MTEFRDLLLSPTLFFAWFIAMALTGILVISTTCYLFIKQARERKLLTDAWYNSIRKDPPIE